MQMRVQMHPYARMCANGCVSEQERITKVRKANQIKRVRMFILLGVCSSCDAALYLLIRSRRSTHIIN